MRVRDVARALDVSPSTVYALVAAGRLKATRHGLGRGAIRVSDAALADYLRSVETQERAPPRQALRHLRP